MLGIPQLLVAGLAFTVDGGFDLPFLLLLLGVRAIALADLSCCSFFCRYAS